MFNVNVLVATCVIVYPMIQDEILVGICLVILQKISMSELAVWYSCVCKIKIK